jgi:hypothetical protein
VGEGTAELEMKGVEGGEFEYKGDGRRAEKLGWVVCVCKVER